MRKYSIILGLCLPLLSFGASVDTLLMGSAFSFTAIHDQGNIEQKAIRAGIDEVIRIEKLISSWDTKSQTSKINANAGIHPVKADKELIQLIQRSKKISQLSKGAFDISFASLKPFWKFDSTYAALPDSALVEQSIQKINYINILLTDSTVFLKEKGMKIDFGAIGKGYAANRAKLKMIATGIENGIVNAGGDLICWGVNEEKKDWSIGIADPTNKTNIISWLNISNMAVVTSGNYEKFIQLNDQKYCHILNPKTGWPVGEIQSVTIICKDAEIADAIATTVFILGKEEGIHFLNKLKGIEGFIVDDQNNLLYSNHIHLNKLHANE